MEADEPRKSSTYVPGQLLDDLSIEELSSVITELKDEISRLEAEILRKSADMSAAESLFRR